MIIIACSIFSSWFLTASLPDNDTIKEIVIWTGLLACLSTWIALIVYSVWENVYACSWVALISGWLGKEETSRTAKKILKKILDDKIK